MIVVNGSRDLEEIGASVWTNRSEDEF